MTVLSFTMVSAFRLSIFVNDISCDFASSRGIEYLEPVDVLDISSEL